jgi:hypothetical protein
MDEDHRGQIKQADFLLAPEHFLERIIRFDQGLVLRVLQFMTADLFRHFLVAVRWRIHCKSGLLGEG